MKQNKRRNRFLFSTVLSLLLISCGWYAVVNQSRSLEASTIETYQKVQLEVVRSTARAAQLYISHELEKRPQAIHQIEQEVISNLIQPVRIGMAGNIWLYSSDDVVFDDSKDLAPEYQGKSIALIFALQKQFGAWHYQEMVKAVMQGREGVGWYVWQPNKAKDAAPWWEWLTQDTGREIAAWSPVVVPIAPHQISQHQRIWVIGISAMLPELMRINGAYAQIQSFIITMSIMTVAVMALAILLRRNRAALEASEAHYRAIVEGQMEMICRFRCDGALTFVNQAYAETFGVVPTRLKGANAFDLIPQTELSKVLQEFLALSAEHPVIVSEWRITSANQQVCWQQWTNQAIFNSRGQVVEIQSVGRDITNQKLYEAEIERLAFTDPLTGLANRRRLYDAGEKVLAELVNQPTATALIYLDLDRFKPINDALGHDAGDELLIQVAKRLRACTRESDLLARLGGDEFAILLMFGSLAEAKRVAARILTALTRPFHLLSHEIQIGCSLGIATTLAGMSFSQLLTQADIAMYRAKSQGRGTYAVFDAAMRAETLSRHKLETDLHQAIDRGQLRVYYQPIISLTSCHLVGFEAVVRWQHPERGLLVPADFLLIAEEVGCSLAIERWVIQQACQQAVWWQRDSTNSNLLVSVNLSSQQLACLDLVTYLESLLNETRLAPANLLLEITEDMLIQQPDLALATLSRLRQLGIKIGLDDFGIGYSSLNYLHRSAADILKIDRSLISAMSDLKTAEIVRSIVMLAASLDIHTVAEGIETADQLAQLRTLACDFGQGYFFAEPLNQFAARQFLKCHSQRRLKMVN